MVEPKYELVKISEIKFTDEFERFQAKADKDSYKKGIKELAVSIRENGLMNPITLVKLEKDGYLLKAGSRRLAAGITLGWKEIPAMVYSTDNVMLTIIENLQKEDMTTLEKGEWINRLVEIKSVANEKGEKPKREDVIKEISDIIGKSPRTIYDLAKTAKDLTPEEKARIKAGQATATETRNKKRNPQKKQNPGQVIKRTGKAFYNLSDKLCDKLKFIGSNSAEYSKDKQFLARFQKLEKFVQAVRAKL